MVPGGHENNIREAGWVGRDVGAIDLAGEMFVRIAGRGAG